MGDQTLLCRIDRLRSNDQFNSNTSFLYTDLIITTSDIHPQTLHTFNAHLLNSCIAERLIIITIHGRLEIPSLNSTSFNCPGGLVGEDRLLYEQLIFFLLNYQSGILAWTLFNI
jgi:hypothetical protein